MRNVRIATVSFEISEQQHTVQGNLDRARKYIEEAAAKGADIVCLPEIVISFHTSDVLQAENFPGEWTEFFQATAKKNGIAIVAPFYVKENGKQFNQATVIDKRGNAAGYYRKLQPTGREVQSVTPGGELPMIDLGFAKVAVMICMDIYFPEIARIYAMKGAEILFWPTMTHGPTQAGLEAQARVRAMDNSLILVEANYGQAPPYAPYMGRFFPSTGRIFDHNGDIIASTGRRPGLAIADVDLDEERKTLDCFLIDSDIDHTRKDIESLVRLDLYAKEYESLAKNQKRFYDTIKH